MSHSMARFVLWIRITAWRIENQTGIQMPPHSNQTARTHCAAITGFTENPLLVFACTARSVNPIHQSHGGRKHGGGKTSGDRCPLRYPHHSDRAGICHLHVAAVIALKKGRPFGGVENATQPWEGDGQGGPKRGAFMEKSRLVRRPQRGVRKFWGAQRDHPPPIHAT